MSNTIILKKSSVASKVPLATDLAYGELAINYADGKLFFKNSSNSILSFTESSSTVTLTDFQTLTNKRINTRVVSVASGATITPTSDTADQYEVTALAVATTVANPTGTPVDGQSLIIRMKDNGTARAITWGANYRVIGSTLPTTTTASKTMYIGCLYNSADSFWDVVAVAQEA